MKVLVTGVKGQLGYDVVNELEKRGHTAIGTDVEEMDITDAGIVRKVMTAEKPDAVIHCAAYTAVDAAEDNIDLCRKRDHSSHRRPDDSRNIKLKSPSADPDPGNTSLQNSAWQWQESDPDSRIQRDMLFRSIPVRRTPA